MSPCRAPAENPCLCSDLCRSLDIALAVAEDDRVLEILGAANEPAQRFAFGGAAGRGDETLFDVVGRRCRAGHLDAHRIVQEGLGETGDFRRHGRREEQGLAGEGHQLADALDVRNEPHVEHAVGFVDDQNLDAGQQQFAAFGKVEKTAGRCNEHVGAARDLGLLVAEGDAADEQREIELVVDAVFGEGLLDLRGEFARRFEDEGARHAGAGAALLEPRQHRKREGGGLSGARLGDAENVASDECVGDGLRLDRCGSDVAGCLDCGQDFLAEAEIFECHLWVVPESGSARCRMPPHTRQLKGNLAARNAAERVTGHAPASGSPIEDIGIIRGKSTSLIGLQQF